jgi:transposase
MNERGKPLLRKQLKRDQMAVLFANLLPCLIGMGASSGTHY